MASKRRASAGNSFGVMATFRTGPTVSTREIASRVGISNGAAYYCVTALIEKGLLNKISQNLKLKG